MVESESHLVVGTDLGSQGDCELVVVLGALQVSGQTQTGGCRHNVLELWSLRQSYSVFQFCGRFCISLLREQELACEQWDTLSLTSSVRSLCSLKYTSPLTIACLYFFKYPYTLNTKYRDMESVLLEVCISTNYSVSVCFLSIHIH